MNKKYVDPNKRHYFDKLRPAQYKDVFANLGKTHKITMWEKGNEDAIEEMTFVRYDFELKRFFLAYQTSFFNKLKGCSLEDKIIGFRFNIDRYQYFSVSKLGYDREEGQYYFDIIEDVYIAQQRKNYRLNADRGITIELVIGHHVLRCNDISAGGTSILVPDAIDENFAEGQEYKGCPLTFNDKTYVIDKIKLVKRFKNEDSERTGAVFYGVQFMAFDPAAEEALALQINNEARAKEIRKKMAEMKGQKAEGQK